MALNVQAYEVELKKYLAIEQAITAISPAYAIGPLWVETTALKTNLKTEAVAWKAHFARNLHRKGKEDLQVGVQHILALFPAAGLPDGADWCDGRTIAIGGIVNCVRQ